MFSDVLSKLEDRKLDAAQVRHIRLMSLYNCKMSRGKISLDLAEISRPGFNKLNTYQWLLLSTPHSATTGTQGGRDDISGL